MNSEFSNIKHWVKGIQYMINKCPDEVYKSHDFGINPETLTF